MARLLIVTDSLGFPNPAVPVEDAWIHRIRMKFKDTFDTYTFIHHYLSTKDLVTDRYLADLVDKYEPEMLVLQVGIVDCCRRAATRRWWWLLKALHVRRFVSKYHYQLTRMAERKEVSEHDFRRNLHTVLWYCQQRKVFTSLIQIASAGSYLARQTANVQNDINRYNQIIREVTSNYSYATFLESYKDHVKYAIGDGVHLNGYGHKLVSDSVTSWMFRLLVHD